jgi:hypothetical protein
MARKPNYDFERNARAKAKAAKREAKRAAKAAAREKKAGKSATQDGADPNATGGPPEDTDPAANG